MNEPHNVDPAEIAHFNRMAELWWDPDGKMGQLHAINALRLRFITDRIPGTQPRIADIGCGGGILAEALARTGARVTGIDLSKLSLEVARQHSGRPRKPGPRSMPKRLSTPCRSPPLRPPMKGGFPAVTKPNRHQRALRRRISPRQTARWAPDPVVFQASASRRRRSSAASAGSCCR